MNGIPLNHVLFLAGLLFSMGVVTLLVRRNVLFMLIGIEIMLNACGLAFIAAGARWDQADGQVMFIFMLTMSACEVCVGLALVLRLYRELRTLDADAARELGE